MNIERSPQWVTNAKGEVISMTGPDGSVEGGIKALQRILGPAPVSRSASQGIGTKDGGLTVITTDTDDSPLEVSHVDAGWYARVIQGGTGRITFVGVMNIDNLTKTRKQGASVNLYATGPGEVWITGDLGTL